MLGFTIFPEHANESHPIGDPTKKPQHEAAYRGAPIKEYGGRGQEFMTPLAVVSGFGIPAGEEKALMGIVKSEVSRAENELDFRRGMISRMLERRYEPTLRRAVMDRALSFYRSSRVQRPGPSLRVGQDARRKKLPDNRVNQSRFVTKSMASKLPGPQGASVSLGPQGDVTLGDVTLGDLSKSNGDQRGGTYHRRHPKPGGGYKYIYSPIDEEPTGHEAHKEFIKRRLRRLVDKAGPDGCHPQHPELQDLAKRHGAKYIAEMLHAGGARNKDGKICYGPEPEISKGLKVAPPGAGGAGGGSEGTPPGEQKIWNNRIVEKQQDGKWKVIGHVAGFEGEKIPRATKLRGTAGAKPKAGEDKPGEPKPVQGGHPTHPELRTSELTKEQAAHLIQQLKDAKGK